VEGFLLAPGYIDLSELQFVAVTPESSYDPIENLADDDDVYDTKSEETNGKGGDRLRRLDQQDFYMEGSALDIAVFHLPDTCASSRTGCDWTELGIGARSEDRKELRYCCTAEAISIGLCSGTQKGRLIMNPDRFQGKVRTDILFDCHQISVAIVESLMHPAFLRSQHRLVNVPAEGDYTNHLKYGKFEETQDSGKYIVVFANCNEEGRAVIVQGHTVWKSLHGYLPGDKFGLMYFYGFLFLTYFVILVWYGVSMKMFEDANIPIQSWIFATISMGTLELFFLAGDLFVWNEDGTRFWVAYYVGKSWQTQRYQARKSHF
jgi:Lung seven transmembrane receptor